MNKELEIWQFAAERSKAGKDVMLLLVAESSGSSPGRRGFKMIVASDELAGSIGGGVMEVKLVEEARRILSASPVPDPGPGGAANAFIKQQIHQKNAENPSGMICSGKQTVIFFKLTAQHKKIIRSIISSLEKNEPNILTISSTGMHVKKQPKGWTQSSDWAQNGENFCYRETLGFKNKLFIIGGGHCALALSELMSKIDFHISLFDDRPNLNTIEKNAFVHEIKLIQTYDDIGDVLPSGENNYVVVMTLGYKSDEIVIRKLLEKEFKYFGVLGSRAKMAALLKEMGKEGFPKEKLNRLHTPIGLPINSQTPEEIAVSIAAEIIAVKNFAK